MLQGSAPVPSPQVENNGGLKTLTKHLPAVLGACPVNAHDGPLADGPVSSAPPLTFIDVGAGIYSGTLGHEDFAELDAMADPNDSDALLLLALFRNRSVVHARAASTNLSPCPLHPYHSPLTTFPRSRTTYPHPHPRSHPNRRPSR